MDNCVFAIWNVFIAFVVFLFFGAQIAYVFKQVSLALRLVS
jgi:hypothetical protein